MHKIVIIEGLDGLGKTTLAKLLSKDEKILKKFDEVIYIREPFNYKNVKLASATITQNNSLSEAYKSDILMKIFCGDRADGYSKLISSLDKDKNNLIISDRSFLSTFVYQIHFPDLDEITKENLISYFLKFLDDPKKTPKIDLAIGLTFSSIEKLKYFSSKKQLESKYDYYDNLDIEKKDKLDSLYAESFLFFYLFGYLKHIQVCKLDNYIQKNDVNYNNIVDHILELNKGIK